MRLHEPLVDCPVCKTRLLAAAVFDGCDNCRVACGNCGPHVFTLEACEDLSAGGYTDQARAGLAHQVSQLPDNQLVSTASLVQLRRHLQLPGALERIDRLVQFFAETHVPGERLRLPVGELRARLGCEDSAATHWVLAQAVTLGYVAHDAASGRHTLTVHGWQRHHDLMRDGAGSRHAFMAMRFNDAELESVFRDHLRPAVAQTGIDLRTTSGDHQTAGSIDNRMRVEIRTSRFLVCDLTHGNRGAYWESGFAEGQGRPVFYVCRRDVLQAADAEARPHFDTAHQLIIGWRWDTMAEDMESLKATIRATLPAEVKAED